MGWLQQEKNQTANGSATAEETAGASIQDDTSNNNTTPEGPVKPSAAQAVADAMCWFSLLLVIGSFQMINKPMLGIPGRVIRAVMRRDFAVDAGYCCRKAYVLLCQCFPLLTLLFLRHL